MKPLVLQPRHWIAAATVGALLVAGGLGAGSVAFGQDQSAATAKDVIFARKILMGSIGDNMDEIDPALEGGNIDLPHLKSHADAISIALLAFPHLFPPASNEWKAGATRDPGTDTFSSPDVWTRFTDFYKLAQAGSKAALDASRAQNAEEFRKFGKELRANCDACHAGFMKQD